MRYSTLEKRICEKIPELSIISPALHSHSICHLLRIHTIGRHTGIMLVRSGAHDQNICFFRTLSSSLRAALSVYYVQVWLFCNP